MQLNNIPRNFVSGLVLGFTSQYYTLWTIGEPYKKYTAGMVINGVFTGSYEWVQDVNYVQNLSKNFEDTVAKITAIAAGEGEDVGYTVDLELRGTHSWTRSTGAKGDDTPADVFTFGKLRGERISEATDVWQLNRAMEQELGARRKALARRRLIELGELVKYPHTEVRFGDSGEVSTFRRYSTRRLRDSEEAKKERAAASGHFWTNGARVTVKIKEVHRMGFESAFGYTCIVSYRTEDGKLVKYMGGTPPSVSTEEFMEVKATVKHDSYKGVDETKLQRIKTV